MDPRNLTDVFYVAVLCPENINEKITEFKIWMRDQFGCKAALKSPAHITLVPPFRISRELESELVKAVGALRLNTEKIEITLHDFDHFNNRVLFVKVLPNPLLSDLKKETERYFVDCFQGLIQPENRRFHPHVTIANRDLAVSDFPAAWRHFSGISIRETFTATNVTLLKLVAGKWQSLAQVVL